jgi:hypothetical protein
LKTTVPANDSTTPNTSSPVALFDASHGQPNWAQTGFPSRELHSNFAGLTEILCRLGFRCCRTSGPLLAPQLAPVRLLVIPPPTGRYDARKERWRAEPTSRLTDEEIRAVLDFVHHGGRLLAFSYRFGDSFTQTNLRDLFQPLGCQLNDDAVIDATALRRTHPLQLHFDTPGDSLPLHWARNGVTTVRWRPAATFSLLPGATAWPLVLSPGGSCLSFNRTLRRISFVSLPLALAGRHGRGRFALFGGSHLFETSPLGLLAGADNTRFLQNTLHWLLGDSPAETVADPKAISWCGSENTEALTRIDGQGDGERTIASVERVLRKTGVLKALNRAKWLP